MAKKSRAQSNAASAYRGGIRTGKADNLPTHRSPDGPCRCENFVHANPDKYVHGHPPVKDVEEHRTQNPVAKTITGRVLRAIPRTK